MRRATTIAAALAGCSLVVAACGGGGGSDSILDAGNEDVTTTVAATGDDATAATDDGASADGSGSADAEPTTTIAPTTTTTPLDSLRPCPVDALPAEPAEPVEVLMWHGLTGETKVGIERLAEQYNASQSRVRVRLEPQDSYDSTIDKYLQSNQGNRPDLVMFPEYFVQQMIDTDSAIPIGACVQAADYDIGPIRPATLAAYATEGVQWGMPFNVSNPVLYYNKKAFVAAGLDPESPPQSLEELRTVSQQLVDSGAVAYGIALDSGPDSGGGWFVEQWLANGGELYANNGNGRLAPATEVLFDGPGGVELLTYVQELVADGLAFYVGGNASGQDTYLKIADQAEPAAMTIGTSAAMGTVLTALDGGIAPGLTAADLGIGPLPGPSGTPTALVGGASLYVVADHGDETAAAAWDFVQFLISPESQSQWAVDTGYVPIRSDALDLDPVKTTYANDPRFRVAYDQLVGSPEDDPALQGPILGPQREVRVAVARAVAQIMEGGDVQTALTEAADQADALIRDYNALN